MNNHNLWQQLSEHKLVKQQYPPQTNNNDHEIPWYIMIIHGFSGWLAAFFLLAFFGSTFSFLFAKATSLISISVGIACSAGSYLIVKSHKNYFWGQLGTAISLCGQLMVAIGIFYLADLEDKHAFYILASYQLLLSWFIPQFVHRFLSCGFGLISLLIALNLSGLYGVGSAILSVVFSFIWLKDHQWGKSEQKWSALGLAIATTMVIASGFLLSDRSLLLAEQSESSHWLFINAGLINSMFIAMVFVNAIVIILKENQVSSTSKAGILSFVASAALVLISFKIYGLSTGILIAIIGFSRAHQGLILLGILAVLGFFSWYYYQLDETLLFKSLILVVLGIFSLISWFFIQTFFQKSPQVNTAPRFKSLNNSHWSVLITIIVVLISTNYQIYQKQQLIESGETLLFKLAPADPRSIMQGDYMRLRFEVAVQTAETLRKKYLHEKIPSHSGTIIVEKKSNNVVSFVNIYDNQTLTKNQYKIPYKYRKYRVVMITDAFYFQEGQSQHFAQAEYGQFKRSEQGELLLVNLADDKLTLL